MFVLTLASVTLIAALWGGWVVYRASRAVSQSVRQVAGEAAIDFTSISLGQAAPAGFEAVPSPAVFQDAAVFHGSLYVCGPAGLIEYAGDGGVRARYRAGLELPGPLAAVATGIVAGADPELFVATSGAGLLAFNGRTFRQIRPEAAAYRKLTAVLPLPTGRLLLGTANKGVLVYDGKRIAPFHPALAGLAVTALAGDDSSVWAGLLAFNGRTFRQIRPEAAAYRKLTAVLPLPTGRLLLGTANKGVLVYDGKRIAPFHPALAGLAVTALAGDDSSVWVGTVDGGLLHWHAGEVDRFGEDNGLPDRRVLSVAVSGASAYAGTPMGVAEFANGKFKRVLAEGVFAQSLLVRGGNTLAVGTLEEGVFEVPLAGGRPKSAAVPGGVERLLDIDGSLYAVARGGVYAVDKQSGGWRSVLSRESAPLADRNISALEFDSAGRLWVGYFDRGLDILEPGLDRATHVENDHVFCVNRIVEDRERGLTAVATANGLVLFDAAGRQRQVLGRAQGLIADHVTDVLLRPGGMTVATPAGITLIDGSGMRSLYAFHGLVNNHAYTLAGTGTHVLVGTLGGLSVLDGDAVTANYTTANSGLRHNWITAIVPVGAEWFVGTYGAGVLRMDAAGNWRTFSDLRTPFEVNSNAMLATGAAVYAGSLSSGLYIYERASGRWRNVTAGLPSANVTALAAHGGYIYIGTDNGLVRFKES